MRVPCFSARRRGRLQRINRVFALQPVRPPRISDSAITATGRPRDYPRRGGRYFRPPNAATTVTKPETTAGTNVSPRAMLVPLALTQFVASLTGSSMNVSITSISHDIGTTVHGVQTAITLFLLCMAALMIPGSKLTDKLGRKWCLLVGLSVYGAGAVVAALAPVLEVLIL